MIITDITTIARRDLRVAWNRRGIRTSIVAFPVIGAVALSLVVRLILTKGGGPVVLPRLLTAFLFFFVKPSCNCECFLCSSPFFFSSFFSFILFFFFHPR